MQVVFCETEASLQHIVYIQTSYLFRITTYNYFQTNCIQLNIIYQKK